VCHSDIAKITILAWLKLNPDDTGPRAPLGKGIAAYRNAMQAPVKGPDAFRNIVIQF
jgi:hypothetical protein